MADKETDTEQQEIFVVEYGWKGTFMILSLHFDYEKAKQIILDKVKDKEVPPKHKNGKGINNVVESWSFVSDAYRIRKFEVND